MVAPAPPPAPGPEGAPAAGPVDELVDELLTLRRRADEHASLLRSNQLAVGQLTESVAALVEQQRKRSRAINLSSYVAYLMFTVLLGAAFYFLYRSRVAELGTPRTAGDARALATAQAQLAARAAASDEAARLYQLGLAGQRDAVAAALATSSHTFSVTERAALTALASPPPLPPAADGSAAAPAVGSAAAPAPAVGGATDPAPVLAGDLGAGIDAYKAGDAARAVELLRGVLAAAPAPADETTARYYLGMATAKLGDTKTAIAELRAALAGDARRVGLADTRYQLGLLHEKNGDPARARAAYDRFATENPQHPMAVEARRRSAALGRGAATGSATTP